MKSGLFSIMSLLMLNSILIGQSVGVNDDGSAPSELLHVKSTAASAKGLLLENSNASGSPIMQFRQGGTTQFSLGVDASDGDKFKIGTTAIGTSTILTINSSGQVGIGTDPVVDFHVLGDMGISGDNHFYVAANNGSGPSRPSTSYSGAAFGWNYSNGDGEMNIWNAYTTLNTTNGGFTFSQMTAAAAHTDLVRIENDGDVGIGNMTPAAKLDVEGDLILENGTSVNEFSTDGTLADDSDDALPTEKAVKTYVDAAVVSEGKLDSEEFTSSGTFNVPSTVSVVWVTAVGAGGGGGGAGGNTYNAGGGGGGAGELYLDYKVAVTPGASITVTIGAAGTGGTGGNNGTDGGDTTFGSLLTAEGGGGGKKGSSSGSFGCCTQGGAGGAGGGAQGAASPGYTSHGTDADVGATPTIFTCTQIPGSSGGSGVDSEGALNYGSAGGASMKYAGGNGQGHGGGGGAASYFGSGGAAGTTSGNGTAAAGTSYGAGGGGAGGNTATLTNNGGSGAAGYLIVYY